MTMKRDEMLEKVIGVKLELSDWIIGILPADIQPKAQTVRDDVLSFIAGTVLSFFEGASEGHADDKNTLKKIELE